MSSYAIFTDAAIELIRDEIPENVHVIPMDVLFGEEIVTIYGDESADFHKNFYQRIKNEELPSTSMIPSIKYEESFREVLEKGQDLIYFSLSSQITGTLTQAQLAKNSLEKEFPDRKMYLIDSLAACSIAGIPLNKAIENLEAGMSVDENAAFLEKARQDILGMGIAMSLTHLYRGGRLSASSALLGTALSIKPLLNFDTEGKLTPFAKARGLKMAHKEILRQIQNHGSKEGPLIISHCDNEKEAEKIKALIEKEFPQYEIRIQPLTPIVGAHLGPEALVITSQGERF